MPDKQAIPEMKMTSRRMDCKAQRRRQGPGQGCVRPRVTSEVNTSNPNVNTWSRASKEIVRAQAVPHRRPKHCNTTHGD